MPQCARDNLLLELQVARRAASELLDSLEHARQGVVQLNDRDMFKHVTGSSSLENAIDQARRAVETYDRMILELSKEPASGA